LLQSNDSVTCQFPSNFNLPNGPINCSALINNTAAPQPTCNVSGNTVTAKGIFNITNITNMVIASVTLSVWPITNPSPAMRLSGFYGTIGNDTSDNNSFFQLSPALFQYCNIEFIPNNVNQN
jgi:hypothetical protein